MPALRLLIKSTIIIGAIVSKLEEVTKVVTNKVQALYESGNTAQIELFEALQRQKAIGGHRKGCHKTYAKNLSPLIFMMMIIIVSISFS